MFQVARHTTPIERNETMESHGNEAVFSVSRLLRLAEDLESNDIAISYAAMYLQILPGRVDRILFTLRHGDMPAAMDVVLSLKVRSHMVGGLALERDCRILEQALRDRDTAAAARAADAIVRDSVRLQLALEEFLQHAED